MNYEQKYKEALNRARDLMTNQNPPTFDKRLIESIFPELNESITIPRAEYEHLKEIEKRMEISNMSNEIQRNTLLYQLELLNRRNELRKEIQRGSWMD